MYIALNLGTPKPSGGASAPSQPTTSLPNSKMKQCVSNSGPFMSDIIPYPQVSHHLSAFHSTSLKPVASYITHASSMTAPIPMATHTKGAVTKVVSGGAPDRVLAQPAFTSGAPKSVAKTMGSSEVGGSSGSSGVKGEFGGHPSQPGKTTSQHLTASSPGLSLCNNVMYLVCPYHTPLHTILPCRVQCWSVE